MNRPIAVTIFALSVSAVVAASACSSSDLVAVNTPLDEAGVDSSVKPPTPTDAAAGCATPLAQCGSSCVDTQNNPTHCGACGKACAAGEACVKGACSTVCPTGQKQCDVGGQPRCVSTDVDRDHCGECGQACATGELCSAGKCALTCQSSYTACAAPDAGVADAGPTKPYCANLQTSEDDCGSCGASCGFDKKCSKGLCCEQGKSNCANACVDVQANNAHCGACGKVCTALQTCTTGVCIDAAPSCKAIKAANAGATSGVYMLDPDGAGAIAPYKAYCEMTIDGGGWQVMAYLRAPAHWNWGINQDSGTVGDVATGFATGATMLAANASYTERVVVYLKIIENGVDLGTQWMLTHRTANDPVTYTNIALSSGWGYRDSYAYADTTVSNVCTHGCTTYRGFGMFHDFEGGFGYAGTQTGDFGCRDGNNICWMPRSLGCNVGSARCSYLTGAGEGVIYGAR